MSCWSKSAPRFCIFCLCSDFPHPLQHLLVKICWRHLTSALKKKKPDCKFSKFVRFYLWVFRWPKMIQASQSSENPSDEEESHSKPLPTCFYRRREKVHLTLFCEQRTFQRILKITNKTLSLPTVLQPSLPERCIPFLKLSNANLAIAKMELSYDHHRPKQQLLNPVKTHRWLRQPVLIPFALEPARLVPPARFAEEDQLWEERSSQHCERYSEHFLFPRF